MRANQNTVTCGNCFRSWNEKIDPAPASLCHFCHGRGSSKAEIFSNEMRAAILFFYINAGYSYDPKRETMKRGRYNCAVSLAVAEFRYIDSDILSAQWEIDPDICSDDWITSGDNYRDGYSKPWHTYQLALIDSSGEYVETLGGIDFGRNGSPDSDNYSRVCVAELASQYVEPEAEPVTTDTQLTDILNSLDSICSDLMVLVCDDCETVESDPDFMPDDYAEQSDGTMSPICYPENASPELDHSRTLIMEAMELITERKNQKETES